MATVPPERRPDRRGRLAVWAENAREAFWVLALGAIAAYAFFLALGAFSPGDALPASILVAVLVVLWLVHAWLARGARFERDPRLRHARERRGF